MGDPCGSRVVRLVRGEALRDVRGEPLQTRTPAIPTSAGVGAGDTQCGNQVSMYGVPVSAVQHCCGRGCKHCRIYWHGKKP